MDKPPYDTPEGKRTSRRLNWVLEYGAAILCAGAVGQGLFGLRGALIGAGVGTLLMFTIRKSKTLRHTFFSLDTTIEFLLAGIVFLALLGLFLVLIFSDISCTT